jgi:hypothetical protein
LRVDLRAQNISLKIDTGSSNVWIPASDSAPCQVAGGCPRGIAFDASSSSSVSFISNNTFQVAYGTGAAIGDFITDTLRFGPAALEDFTLGLASNFTFFRTGLLGIGYDALEAPSVNNAVPRFPGVVTSLKQAGMIDRRAFSFYFDDVEAGTGSVVFGGIDRAKFTGDLTAVSITPNQAGVFDRYRVDLTAVSFIDESGKSTLLSPPNMAAPAAIDTGASISILPTPVLAAIIAGTGAIQVSGFHAVDCALRSSNTSIEFQIGGASGPRIQVPMSEIVGLGSGLRFSDGKLACPLTLGFLGETDAQSIPLGGYTLGDPFLRSAYVVFDVDNNEVYLGQPNRNAAGSNNIQAIPSGSGLPGVSSSATATATLLPTTIDAALSSSLVAAASLAAQPVPTVIPGSAPVASFNAAVASANATAEAGANAATATASASTIPTANAVGRGYGIGLLVQIPLW